MMGGLGKIQMLRREARRARIAYFQATYALRNAQGNREACQRLRAKLADQLLFESRYPEPSCGDLKDAAK